MGRLRVLSYCTEIMKLHPDVQALLDAMRELERFLEQHGDEFWSIKVARAADCVSRSDAYGLERFLSLFGGMGSLNDVVLHRSGKLLLTENNRLVALRSKAWNLASRLRRELG
ncbi:DUF6966 domain-containing protein [Inquilinus limosus]|uniref:DUF6966 domain-containing protein n=1 Tax=Inquilinus limosus TaxID=171674 RepID=UPI00126A5116|nr:hypothetical protein [Inquilinus limosus]